VTEPASSAVFTGYVPQVRARFLGANLGGGARCFLAQGVRHFSRFSRKLALSEAEAVGFHPSPAMPVRQIMSV